jgi:hypothetical protein
MRTLILLLTLSATILSGCDLRSDTAKREMEKFSGTPTPTITPLPDLPPVDPADIVSVDTTQDGDIISVNGPQPKQNISCAKYNIVTVNVNGTAINIKGVCHRIVVNGDVNQIWVDASTEYVFNGTGNEVKYSKYPNGKRPLVVQNQAGNTIEHSPTASPTKTPNPTKR